MTDDQLREWASKAASEIVKREARSGSAASPSREIAISGGCSSSLIFYSTNIQAIECA
jgi:hypothetical protein